MKVLTSKIVNGKKMFLIEDNNPQGKVFAQVGKPIKKENISNYNPYYVDVKGLNASESTKTNLTPTTKITSQEIKKIKESPTNVGNIKIKEAQEKAQRLKEAEEAYKKRKAGAPITPELLAQETQAIGDKISLQNIPGVGQYIPDMLDVTGGIGSMASNLGALPLNLNRGNYGQAALSVAMPLGVGALAGIGNPNTGQFANNLINPFAGTGDLINKLGNKYLPNAHKLNPYAFRTSPEKFYRQVDTPTFNEGLESGLIRGKQDIGYSDESAMKMFGDDAYYNKGRLYYKNEKDYPYLFEANLPEDRFIPKVNGRTRKYTTENTRVRVSKEPLPINDPNITIYKKDWLKGYKQIDAPKQQFKSEIDWAKWNKEIPKSKVTEDLINLYRIQEKNAKPFSELVKEGKIPNVFNRPDVIARKAEEEKYFGQWFTKDKTDLDWYMKDREFTDPEIIQLRVPKSKLQNYTNYDKSLSRAPDREFVVPLEEQSQYRFSQDPKHTSISSFIDDISRGFKSEIDWAKWNKEIPSNQPLLQEYNAIEQSTKKAGTWMKNPDGSKFQGTPEQFVQQNSKNFKKAFGNSKLVNPDGSIKTLYHGSKVENIKEFLSPKRNSKFKENSVTTKDNDYIYFSPDFKSAEWFIPKNKGKMYEVYANVRNPEITDNYRYLANPVNNSQKLNINDAITNIDFNTMKSSTGPSEIAIPFSNKVKSAIGNNGMFDMTNPNIYKTLIPGAMTLGALNQTNEKQFGGTIKVLDTKIEKNKKYYLINE